MAETTTNGFVPEETAIPSAQETTQTAPVGISDGFSPSDEMEMNVSLDQLSYICEYCGKVNAISSPSCVRCGKRRPRSEYVNAMNKLKNANSVKSRYIEEQAKLATDRQEAAQEQLVRLVESRVADEKAQILAQDEIRLEQERDNIKRSTARDAVLRIIAAERAADERVKAAELNAEDALRRRDRAAEEAIAAEREKILYAAAKRVVSERAGIENAAEERIVAERKQSEYKAQDTIGQAVDEAERNAARRAALKIIAGEQAAADRARLERDAISRAAFDRIEEERRIAEMNAYSKYKIEREAMQRAVDERINAEREFLNIKRAEAEAEARARAQETYGYAPGYPQPMMSQQPTTVQPLAIVPYVNTMQPVYQYNNKKQVYRFIPDSPVEEQPVAEAQPVEMKQPEKTKKDFVTMWLSFIAVLFGLAVIAVVVMYFGASLDSLKFIQLDPKRILNIDILSALIKNTRYTVFAGNKSLWYVAPVGLWVMLIGAIVTIVMGVIGVVRGRVPKSFFVYALVAFLGAVITYAGLYMVEAYVFKKTDMITIVSGLKTVGLLIIVAGTFIMLLLSIICTCRSSKGKKKVASPKKKKDKKPTGNIVPADNTQEEIALPQGEVVEQKA